MIPISCMVLFIEIHFANTLKTIFMGGKHNIDLYIVFSCIHSSLCTKNKRRCLETLRFSLYCKYIYFFIQNLLVLDKLSIQENTFISQENGCVYQISIPKIRILVSSQDYNSYRKALGPFKGVLRGIKDYIKVVAIFKTILCRDSDLHINLFCEC